MHLCLLPGAIKAAPDIQMLRDDLDGLIGTSGLRMLRNPRYTGLTPNNTHTDSSSVMNRGSAKRQALSSMHPTQRPQSARVNPHPINVFLPKSGLGKETIIALLALDPFFSGGANATLPESRFVLRAVYEVFSQGEHKP